MKAQKKKLKNLGKSKSTDTEEEEGEDEQGDGELYFARPLIHGRLDLPRLLHLKCVFSSYNIMRIDVTISII